MRTCLLPLSLAATLAVAAAARASEAPASPAAVGQPAPGFTLKDLDGKEFKLADLAGKKVVLEWFNPDCPFIRFAHTKGDLKDQGGRLQAKGVVFLAVNSSAPGREGNGLERNREAKKEYAIPYPVLLDEDGTVGRLYGARTTPHIFRIDEKGVLRYRGAIDNAPFGEVRGGDKKLNYLDQALEALARGAAVDPAETGSYGCGVKYAK